MANPFFDRLNMLIRLVVLSTALLFTFAFWTSAHEVRPAIADVALSDTEISIEIRLTAEPMLAGINLEGLSDTNEAPQADAYDELRALPPEELAQIFRDAWPDLREGLIVRAGDAEVALDLQQADVDDPGDSELPRDTLVRLSSLLPDDGTPVQIGWIAAYGPLIVRQAGAGDEVYAGYLESGALSEPLPRVGTVEESGFAVFVRYIVVGFDHIIPKGLDHILFVLGLFFLSMKLRPLVTQVTVFTVAHTITLALASLGIVSVSPRDCGAFDRGLNCLCRCGKHLHKQSDVVATADYLRVRPASWAGVRKCVGRIWPCTRSLRGGFDWL